jgi:hypothetical protein
MEGAFCFIAGQVTPVAALTDAGKAQERLGSVCLFTVISVGLAVFLQVCRGGAGTG